MATQAEQFKAMKVVDLKVELKSRGLKVGGKKDELIQRLLDFENRVKVEDVNQTPVTAPTDTPVYTAPTQAPLHQVVLPPIKPKILPLAPTILPLDTPPQIPTTEPADVLATLADPIQIEKDSLVGQVVAFSGFRNDELKDKIAEAGGSTSSTVTKKTTILVVKDTGKVTAKIREAEEKGLRIFSIADFTSTFLPPM